MQKPYNKVEGWKTKDGRFHESEDMARGHALNLILEDHKNQFCTESKQEIAAHAQWLYDTMSDLGFRRSDEAISG